MTKEGQRQQWIDRVEEYKASCQSQAAWCKERNINLRTFNYWYCKLKSADDVQNTTTNWLSVKLEKTLKKPEVSVINIKIGNAAIEINPGVDSDHLLKVLRVLNSLC
ncbi:MAG: IS66 family insertion sequence element accessory protein TnpA [Bacillota bacterium]